MSANRTEAEALFKKVDGGWLFRAPNPWVFGDTPHYRVDDAQKAALVQIVNPRHPIRLGLWVGLAILGWVLAVSGVMTLSGIDADKAGKAEFALFVLAIVVPMLAVFPLIGWVQLRRMRPILSCARPSSERISLRDVGRAMKQTYTRKKALMLAAAWLFSGAMQVVTLAVRQHSHPLFGDGLSYLNVFTLVMAVALAAKFIRIAINTKSLATDVAALTPRAG